MHRALKRNLVIGLAALAVAALAGGAYAATQSSAPNTRQAFLNDVAKRLHVTPQQLTQALNGATLDQLQAAVKAGRLTQAQADKLAQRLKQKGAARAIPFGFGFGFGLGPRFVHPPGPGFPGPRFGGGLARPFELQAAASYLGLTDAQLFRQLAGGKSLAQIATSRGKTATGLEQAMTSDIKTRLDKLVANKMMTAAREKAVLSRLSARLAKVINRKGLPAFKGPHFRFRGGALPAPKAPGPNAPAPNAPAPNAPAPNAPAPNAPVPPAYTPAPAAPPVA
jgi:hypothetical protein